MQKLYCFVDESGQETLGRVFVVAVVVVVEHPTALLAWCEELEHTTGKGKFKWGTAKKDLRLDYLRRIFADLRFSDSVRYSVSHATTGYDMETIQAIAKAVNSKKPPQQYTTLIYVDGLKKSKRLYYGSHLRKLGIPTRKVQGITKDENNALIRLADAIAGFVVDAIDGKDVETIALYRQVTQRRVLVEV